MLQRTNLLRDVPLNELIGTPAIREAAIITLADREHLIFDANRNSFPLPAPSRKDYLKDLECPAIDEILDNPTINHLLAPEG